MKLPVFFKISAKYLWRYRRRYLFLFLALSFSFGVVTVISSIKDGMEENLYLSAQSHYAGDIVALGYDRGLRISHHLTGTEIDAILASAEAVKIDPDRIAVRTNLMGKREGSIYFNGNAFSLKYIVGVDWEREADYFNSLSYSAAPEYLDDNSVLLSDPIARELGVRQGDSVILETLTVTDQRNTGHFFVAGIIKDDSFFGYYKVYVSRLTLNRLTGFADGECSLIGFFLKNRASIEEKREALYSELKPRISTGPLVYDWEAFDEATATVKNEKGISTFLITLPVYLSDVAQLMNAIDLASYVLFGMMLAIIMVSAGVTCRLILHERTRETGTLRAIGFHESDVRIMLKLEIFILALFSMAAGFILALFINWGLSYTSFNWFPGFEVFMRDGRLNAFYFPKTIAVNIIGVFCMLALAIGGPIFRNSRNPLPEMLSGGAM